MCLASRSVFTVHQSEARIKITGWALPIRGKYPLLSMRLRCNPVQIRTYNAMTYYKTKLNICAFVCKHVNSYNLYPDDFGLFLFFFLTGLISSLWIPSSHMSYLQSNISCWRTLVILRSSNFECCLHAEWGGPFTKPAWLSLCGLSRPHSDSQIKILQLRQNAGQVDSGQVNYGFWSKLWLLIGRDSVVKDE